MIETKVEIDRASMRKMEKTIEEFAKRTGKTAEDGIAMIASSAGKRLIYTVQPYGVKQSVGEKYKKSIAKQVHRAIRNANVEGSAGTAAAVHRQRRDSKGQVPRELPTDGQFKRKPIEMAETMDHVRKAQAKAGRAKGAWLEAVTGIGGRKVSGIGKWIMDHASSGYGKCIKTGQGLKHKITLENRTTYLSRIQPDKVVAQAVASGLKNAFKSMQRTIDKEIEKANRALK
jgi:hypothetical protein